MDLTYNPLGNDPIAPILPYYQLYWIQRTRNNHPGLTTQHGDNEDALDGSFNDTETPYLMSARRYGATDAPFRIDAENNHFWDAELYLAKETQEGDLRKVTIYNGVKWGWRNESFPRSNADICQYPEIANCTNNPPNTPIDLALVFDTTGSMGSYLQQAKIAFKNLASDLFEQAPGTRVAVVDYRDFPVYPYGDPGDYPYRANLPFSSDLTSIYSAIDGLTIGGGGDWPESLLSALTRTIKTEDLGAWRNGVKKAVIYLTDAPGHDPEPFTGYTISSVVDEAFLVDPAIIYSIVPSYLGSDPRLTMLSNWTGGKLFVAQTPNDVTKRFIEALTDIVVSYLLLKPLMM